MLEYKKVIKPVQLVEGTPIDVKIINRHDFDSLHHLKCMHSTMGNGFIQNLDKITIPLLLDKRLMKLKHTLL
jgi:hypothetical protein